MGKNNTLSNGLLGLVFNATAIANLAQNGTSPLTNLYVSLHTADPTVTGNQTSNETAYTGYSRVAVARTSGGWTVSGESCSPVAAINFGVCTASAGAAITYAAIGSLSSGAGVIYYSGALTPSITMAVGVAPQLTTASTITES